MQTYVDNIEIQPNHTYYHKDVGNVLSVTTILNGGKSSDITTPAMESGSSVHKVIELFLKGRKTEAKELYNDLDTNSQTKVKALVEALKELDITGSSSELSFVTEDSPIKFGGTVDLLTNSYAIDFKTGSFNNKHLSQIAAYAAANSRKEGLILSFNKNKLEKTIVSNQEIATYYSEFTQKAKNLLNIKSPFDLELAEDFNERSIIKQAIAELQNRLNLKDEQIEYKIRTAGYTKYELDNFKAFEVKPRQNTTFASNEDKAFLVQTYPERFKTTTTKPSFVIREGGLKND